MGPRLLTFATVAALALFVVGGTAFAGSERDDHEVVVSKDEDASDVLVTDDDDDDDGDGGGGDSGGFTSGVDSNDGTNSRVTSVTRGDDLSRGDLTRDLTKDGPGASTRDQSRHQTNDRSRHDTR
jgi:hypothetical protein